MALLRHPVELDVLSPYPYPSIRVSADLSRTRLEDAYDMFILITFVSACVRLSVWLWIIRTHFS